MHRLSFLHLTDWLTSGSVTHGFTGHRWPRFRYCATHCISYSYTMQMKRYVEREHRRNDAWLGLWPGVLFVSSIYMYS